MWSFDSGAELIGCGVDCEVIDRFERLLESDPHPMPFVFTRGEVVHALAQAERALVLCISFTGKEAFLKALRAPYNFVECELFPVVEDRFAEVDTELLLAPALTRAHRIARAFCRSERRDREIISSVFVLGEVTA